MVIAHSAFSWYLHASVAGFAGHYTHSSLLCLQYVTRIFCLTTAENANDVTGFLPAGFGKAGRVA